MIKAYEKWISKLGFEKAEIKEKMEQIATPVRGYDKTLRTAALPLPFKAFKDFETAKNEVVPKGIKTLNHQPEEDISQVLEVLQEWNDYLERYAPHFSQSLSFDQTQSSNKTQHSRQSPKPRGLER